MRIRVSLGSPLSSKKSNVRLRMDTLAARPSGLHAFFLGRRPEKRKPNLAAGLCLCQDRNFHAPRGCEGPPPLEAAPVARSSGPEKTLEILAPSDLAHVHACSLSTRARGVCRVRRRTPQLNDGRSPAARLRRR